MPGELLQISMQNRKKQLTNYVSLGIITFASRNGVKISYW